MSRIFVLLACLVLAACAADDGGCKCGRLGGEDAGPGSPPYGDGSMSGRGGEYR